MNVVDWIILGILGLSVLVGLYRGFVSSIASLGGCLGSFLASFWLSPKLVEWVQSHPEWVRTLLSYTDATSRIGDLNLSSASVSTLSQNAISDILSRVSLPAPLNTLLENNLTQQVFSSSGLTQVGDYVSQTILSAILNVLCFIVCFIGLFIVLHILLNFLKVVFRFPVLKQLNAVVGGIFGLLRGALLVIIAFSLLPLVETMVPIDNIADLVAQSTLAPLFNNGSLVQAIMNGRL